MNKKSEEGEEEKDQSFAAVPLKEFDLQFIIVIVCMTDYPY